MTIFICRQFNPTMTMRLMIARATATIATTIIDAMMNFSTTTGAGTGTDATIVWINVDMKSTQLWSYTTTPIQVIPFFV